MSLPAPERNPLVVALEGGAAPEPLRRMAAQGFLPLAPDEVARVQLILTRDPEPEIADLARAAVRGMPAMRLVEMARDPLAEPATLDALASASDAEPVLEAVARHRATGEDTLLRLAASDNAAVQEVLITNQTRLLGNRALFEALERNSRLVPEVRRRVAEFRQEFLVKDGAGLAKAAREEIFEEDLPLPDADLGELPDDIIALFIDVPDDEATADSIRDLYDDDELAERRKTLFQRVINMLPPQKIQLALKGNREARSLLIRDSNKLVSTSVVRSPRISEPEIEAISRMKNIAEEVLRIVGTSREHLKRYTVVHNLVSNPRTPPGVSVPLVGRLSMKDLKKMSTDKGVSDIVRTTAYRIFKAKGAK